MQTWTVEWNERRTMDDGKPGLMVEDVPVALDTLADTSPLAAVYGWWRGFSPAPRLSDVDPLALPPVVLSGTLLLDYQPPDTFRVRLAGTEVCADYGRELKGLTLEEILDPAEVAAVAEPFLAVVRTGRPDLRQRCHRTARHRDVTYLRLALPLAGETAGVTGLLVCGVQLAARRPTMPLEQDDAVSSSG